MKAILSTLLMLLVPCIALAGAPAAATTAQLDLIHPVFIALHVAKDMHHPHPHEGNPAEAPKGPPPAGVETLQVDSTRSFAPADGSTTHSTHVVGALSIQSATSSSGPSHTLSGTVTTTDAHGTATVTFTGVTKNHGERCMLPSAGSAALKAADGSQHTITFTSTCGQITLDGATVMLPAPPHGGHGE